VHAVLRRSSTSWNACTQHHNFEAAHAMRTAYAQHVFVCLIAPVHVLLQVEGKYGKGGKATKMVATGLSREGASKYMFSMRDRESGEENEMSVAAYFSNSLGIKLEFPHLQCVTVRRSL
jgi:hypothetical protein